MIEPTCRGEVLQRNIRRTSSFDPEVSRIRLRGDQRDSRLDQRNSRQAHDGVVVFRNSPEVLNPNFSSQDVPCPPTVQPSTQRVNQLRNSMSVLENSSRKLSTQGRPRDKSADEVEHISMSSEVYSSHLFNSESYLCHKGSFRRGFGGDYRSSTGYRSHVHRSTSPKRLSLTTTPTAQPLDQGDYSYLLRQAVTPTSELDINGDATVRKRSGYCWSPDILHDGTLVVYASGKLNSTFSVEERMGSRAHPERSSVGDPRTNVGHIKSPLHKSASSDPPRIRDTFGPKGQLADDGFMSFGRSKVAPRINYYKPSTGDSPSNSTNVSKCSTSELKLTNNGLITTNSSDVTSVLTTHYSDVTSVFMRVKVNNLRDTDTSRRQSLDAYHNTGALLDRFCNNQRMKTQTFDRGPVLMTIVEPVGASKQVDSECILKKTDSSDSGIDTKTDSFASRTNDECVVKYSDEKPPEHETSCLSSDIKPDALSSNTPLDKVDDRFVGLGDIGVETDSQKCVIESSEPRYVQKPSLTEEELTYEKLADEFVIHLDSSEHPRKLCDVASPPGEYNIANWYLSEIFPDIPTGATSGYRRAGCVNRSGADMYCPITVEERKMVIIECAKKKLNVLETERITTDTKLAQTKDYLQAICTTAKERLQTKQFHDKLDLYVDELHKVLRLLLLLSSRLAHLDNTICLSNSATSKKVLIVQRIELTNKLSDAKCLNDVIDARRRHLLTAYLTPTLTGDECQTFEATIDQIRRLTFESQWIKDRISLAEQQLTALRMTSSSDVTSLPENMTLASNEAPSSGPQ